MELPPKDQENFDISNQFKKSLKLNSTGKPNQQQRDSSEKKKSAKNKQIEDYVKRELPERVQTELSFKTAIVAADQESEDQLVALRAQDGLDVEQESETIDQVVSRAEKQLKIKKEPRQPRALPLVGSIPSIFRVVEANPDNFRQVVESLTKTSEEELGSLDPNLKILSDSDLSKTVLLYVFELMGLSDHKALEGLVQLVSSLKKESQVDKFFREQKLEELIKFE